ncbi:solute:sodium symporter family transporter [Butyricicoccus sp. Marseille-Q5471]|uniref:solute:sodium symporter family transporter n=1 Tax=Butyricicoccus sp. Marseille-Q5471 TaxID=3039493 RepID=UPI0024BC2AAA|nr:solute:sodium symporter family transporter [Butyricicoccus sp. Marseille-Q5471]
MKLLMLVTFIGFTALVALISYLKTRGDDTSTKDGYFLAGRGLPGIVICGSLMMTNISAEQLVGQNGQSYIGSMGVMGWELFAGASLAIFALFMLPRFLKCNITTIPEFLENRYGSSIRRLVAIIFMAAYIITMLPLILYAGSVVLEQLFDVSGMLGISRFAAIAICCVSIGIIGSIYAIFGGLRAVAVSDTINGIGLMLGCAIIVPALAFTALGDGSFLEGVKAFVGAGEKLNALAPANALAPSIPWPLLLTGMIINGLSYWATNQSIIQRTFAAKNLAEAQKGALWTGFLKCFSPLFTVVPGIIAFLMFGGGLENQDLAYPQLILTVMPKWLLGFFAAVMFGAILSSFNSVLNSASTIFTLDFYRPIFNPNASDAQLVHTGKVFGTVIAAVAIAISPFILFAGQGVQAFLNECWGYYGTPLLIMVIFALTKLPVPAKACWIMSGVHVALYAIGLNTLSPHYCHYLYITTTVFVVDTLIMLAFSKFAPAKQTAVAVDAPQVDMTPWRHSKGFAIGVVILMVVLYLVFSPLILGR